MILPVYSVSICGKYKYPLIQITISFIQVILLNTFHVSGIGLGTWKATINRLSPSYHEIQSLGLGRRLRTHKYIICPVMTNAKKK